MSVNSMTQSLTDYYFNLGGFQRCITTSSKDAQTWFNRGLIWTYAFNHGESAACFKKAIDCDRDCAMAEWGLGYCQGPNYNKPWSAFDLKEVARSVSVTHSAAQRAKAKYGNASLIEKALIDALQFRYQDSEPAEDLDIWNQQYAKAMESVYKKYSDDLDVAALYADALMNLTPAKMWDLHSRQPAPTARTVEAKAVLDAALSREDGLQHPGLLHLYIHLMDMSGTPEEALNVADRLRGLVPDAGHLEHMPSHIDIVCGDYRRAVASNLDGMRADRKYMARAEPLSFYTVYTAHNFHFCIYAAMFSGQSKIAIKTAGLLEKAIPEELLRMKSPPMADWLEGFVGMRMHVLIRFGRWKDIMELEPPIDSELYCVTTAMVNYAKGVAFAAMGRIEKAEKQRLIFKEAVKHVPATRRVFEVSCLDMLAIAGATLDGELAYRQGKFDTAFEELRRSVVLYDKLPYMEPWGWMQPARHALGALLLEQGHVKEAAEVYSADLGIENTIPRALQHPNNVWALHGFHECLMKIGRTAEARILEPQMRMAMAVADVPVRSSCFCRLNCVS